MRRLAGRGALMAIVAVALSLCGMNFGNMPALGSNCGYRVQPGAVLAVCIWFYRRLKRFGWL